MNPPRERAWVERGCLWGPPEPATSRAGDHTVWMLLALARVHLPEEAARNIERRLNSGACVNWDALARWALQGGIAGLVARHLNASPDWPVPGAVRRDLAGAALLTAHANRRQLALAAGILKDARVAGVALFPLKGTTFHLEGLYDEPGLRSQSDIDFLVPRAQFAKAMEVLKSCGFEPAPSSLWALSYHHNIQLFQREALQPIVVELHWTPFAVPRPHSAVVERLLVRAGDTIEPTDTVLYAAVHLARHRFCAQLKWLVDIAELLRRHTLDWPRFWSDARELGAARAVGHAIALARDGFGVAVPDLPPSRLREAMGWVSNPRHLVESRPQPPWASRVWVDALTADRPRDLSAYFLNKGLMLSERYLGLRPPSRFVKWGWWRPSGP